MVGTIKKGNPDITHRITRQDPGFQSFLHALFNGGNILSGDNPSNNFIDEFQTYTWLSGLNPQKDMTILTPATCLLDVFSFGFGRTADGFPIRHLRFANIRLNFKLAKQTINNDFQMQLSHSRNQSLPGFFITLHMKGRILLSELAKRIPELFKILLGLGFNGQRNHGLGEFDYLEQNMLFLVA